jgi:hypothetical protein
MVQDRFWVIVFAAAALDTKTARSASGILICGLRVDSCRSDTVSRADSRF